MIHARHRWFNVRPARLARCLAASAVAVGLAGCEEGGGAATASPEKATAEKATATNPDPAAPAIPRLSFEKLEHDFGTITDTETYRTSFAFRNTGNARLEITEIKAACGCTVPTLRKRQYEPGESGQLDIVFDPKGKQGETPKYITVFSNSQPDNELKLKLVSLIEPLLKIERMQKLGTITLGEEYRKIIPVYYQDPDLEITSISSNNEHVTGALVETGIVDSSGGDETTYRADVEVTVSKDAPWGLLYATRLAIETRGRPRPEAAPVDYKYDIFLTGNVFGEMRMTPAIIGLSGFGQGAQYEKSVTISRVTGQPFTIIEATVAESTMPGVEVRVETASPASQRVIMSGNIGQFRGSIRGRLAIRTDVPGEELLEVRFSGYVQ